MSSITVIENDLQSKKGATNFSLCSTTHSSRPHKNKLSICSFLYESDTAENLPDYKRKRISFDPHCDLQLTAFSWRVITGNNLNLKYSKIFPKRISDHIFRQLEDEVIYFGGDLLKVKVFGKWHNIPRKQAAYGHPGLSYAFSGNCLPAVPWQNCNIIKQLKEVVESVTNCKFNFVLVNRYKDGSDHMGEHRDDEKDLVPEAPIASLSFGQARDFIFRHKDYRKKTEKPDASLNVRKLELEHGSLLVMEW
ncbi:Alpha-ketoglutarate-dependent dioxygenase alkB-like protein, partial [Stegodyphus mimosarum]